MTTKHAPLAVFAVALTTGATGCSPQTIESATRDTARNTQIVVRETERAKKKLDPQLKQLGIGARVTAALKANENLPMTIRVDADKDAQGIKLRGTVKTSEQKKLAERIARETLGKDKRVQNDLKVEELE